MFTLKPFVSGDWREKGNYILKIIFVSNYINHHQIPFCNAMCEQTGGSFRFIQTEPMEEERVKMGWQREQLPAYVKCFYEEPEVCRRLILESGVVLFGGSDEESYIAERLASGLPVIRMSERLYKTGQWKAVSPRGLLKKYKDHTRHRGGQVFLLCAGAYVPSDFHIVYAYPGKMYRWGYFPETKRYDVDKLLEGKGYAKADGQRVPSLLWAARMIDWKHPDLPLRAAAYLKEKGLSFHMDIIGGGEKEETVRALWKELELEGCVTLLGFQPPEQVRKHMEKADIYLVTSDRQEGWGAVVNEAMNSGCAVVANHMIGAAPYLIRHGENGLVYEDGREKQLYELAERLVRERGLCGKLGRAAYKTVTEEWNAENAAACLMELIVEKGLLPVEAAMEAGGKGTAEFHLPPKDGILLEDGIAPEEGIPLEHGIAPEEGTPPEAGFQGKKGRRTPTGPCSPAPVISERKMYRYLTEGKR